MSVQKHLHRRGGIYKRDIELARIEIKAKREKRAAQASGLLEQCPYEQTDHHPVTMRDIDMYLHDILRPKATQHVVRMIYWPRSN